MFIAPVVETFSASATCTAVSTFVRESTGSPVTPSTESCIRLSRPHFGNGSLNGQGALRPRPGDHARLGRRDRGQDGAALEAQDIVDLPRPAALDPPEPPGAVEALDRDELAL